MISSTVGSFSYGLSLSIDNVDVNKIVRFDSKRGVTNFIRPYLHQFFDDSHSLNGYGKPLKRPFDRYQLRLEVISIGRDIRQINW